MKTPDEIKKNARTCISHPVTESCYSCSLHSECHGLVEYVIKDLLDLVLMYESSLEQVKREKDAAIQDMAKSCVICKHSYLNNPGIDCCPYVEQCQDYAKFEWIGVREENTHDQP